MSEDIEWIKLYIDIFGNRKIKQIRALPRGNDIVLIWIMLLTIAGRCNADGFIYVTKKIPYTPDSLEEELKFKSRDIEHALNVLEQYDMIARSGDMIYIPGWEEYQNVDGMERVRKKGRERQAKYRERQREKAENIQNNVTVTLRNDDVTQQNKKEELDKEEKKEYKKESETPIVELILIDGSQYPICQNDVAEWSKLYPNANVEQEFRNMAGWCIGNPSKRKTKSGIRRFINSWLSKTQKEIDSNERTGRNVSTNERDAYAESFDESFQ